MKTDYDEKYICFFLLFFLSLIFKKIILTVFVGMYYVFNQIGN